MRARGQSAYLLGKFIFFGIDSKTRKNLQKLHFPNIEKSQDLRQATLELWNLDQRECQYAALDLLQKKKKLWNPDFFSLFTTIIEEKPWWDSVDMIASNLIGKLLFDFPELRFHMDEWIESENLWKRRVSLLFQLKYKEKTDIERLFRYIEKTSHEKEFFIKKAIGWALRELSKSNKQMVRELLQSGITLSHLSKKEASKYLIEKK